MVPWRILILYFLWRMCELEGCWTWPTSEWKRVMLMDSIKLICIPVVLWFVVPRCCWGLHILCGSLTIGGLWKPSGRQSTNCEHWPYIEQLSLLFRQLFLDLKNGITYACSTADWCPVSIVVNCWQYAPDVVPDMPQMMHRHATDVVSDLPQMMT